MIERSPFLPIPEEMVFGQVEIMPTQLKVVVIAIQSCSHRAGCRNPSDAFIDGTSERVRMPFGRENTIGPFASTFPNEGQENAFSHFCMASRCSDQSDVAIDSQRDTDRAMPRRSCATFELTPIQTRMVP